LARVVEQAAHHKGTAFVEVYQNCNIFNDGAFAALKDNPTTNQVRLVHGEPIRFGDEGERGVVMRPDAGVAAGVRPGAAAAG
jgi:2-oxoglutarate ferredoxin oxidoreductase subunit beta